MTLAGKMPFSVEMPWNPTSVPHATIEVNQKCNIDCHGCYKIKNSYSKPLDLVFREIDQVAKARNLESITLLGGEPTLHEELPQIIKHISSKGILPSILTNGSTLTQDTLRKYKEAGLYSVRLHIDKHRHHRPDALDVCDTYGLREKYIRLCREVHINVSLALTLYKDNFNELNDLLELCQQYGIRDVLVTLYLESINGKSTSRYREENLSVSMAEAVQYFSKTFGGSPAWFIPSQKNQKELRWAIYSLYYTRKNQKTTHRMFLSPQYRMGLRLIPKLSLYLSHKYNFLRIPRSYRKNAMVLLCYAICSCSFPELFGVLRLLICGKNGHSLNTVRIAFQKFTEVSQAKKYDPCKFCPDATIRNGRLIPVCIADHISPLAINPKEEEDVRHSIA